MGQLDLIYKSPAVKPAKPAGRLVVVSNRVMLPASSKEPAAGGLAVALAAVLKARGGLWFGWSGKTGDKADANLQVRTAGPLTFATCDLPQSDIDHYYCGFANRTLWPVCHYRLDLADLSESNAAAYFRVNERFASQLQRLLRPDDIIWVHDYHLIPLAHFLRQLGCANRIGFFLHVPWPGPAIASALPCYQRLLRSFGAYDVVGFQTQMDAEHFRDCILKANAGLAVGGTLCEIDGHWLRSGAFPIGIGTEAFAKEARNAERTAAFKRVLAELNQRDLIIGVDRLDYTKGLKHRVKAFGAFLDRASAEVRRRTSLLQVTPKSRSEIPEYERMQCELAEEVGRINGKFGDVDWTPIRYINKPLRPAALAGLYRMSCAALVTPLRDGMNLVAKEYVAAQAPDNPGVLILSQFAGAAEELKSALVVNPYDVEATADAIVQAVAMPLEERKERWQAMMTALRANTVHDWAFNFLEALMEGAEANPFAARKEYADVPGPAGVSRPDRVPVAPWRIAGAEPAISIKPPPAFSKIPGMRAGPIPAVSKALSKAPPVVPARSGK
ncbi:MAG: alpha,alpha-trehalose-phosphate synthase (UDP-forming) [Methylocapsa sp.]|nr:alpha,alpha-trehalose-phosphate synthase (UDP-forming) [Methylocapsa sp.]